VVTAGLDVAGTLGQVPFLSPAKLLVILVVALIVLGPEKLPRMARQIGGLWSDFRKFRERLESDVRGSFPDLPSTDRITQAVRSPLSFLDSLADTHASDEVRSSTRPIGNDIIDDDGAPPAAENGDTTIEGPMDETGNRETSPDGSHVPGSGTAGVVHQLRRSEVIAPDDPGMN
jgi:sec-independent protein translocase protein TatB